MKQTKHPSQVDERLPKQQPLSDGKTFNNRNKDSFLRYEIGDGFQNALARKYYYVNGGKLKMDGRFFPTAKRYKFRNSLTVAILAS